MSIDTQSEPPSSWLDRVARLFSDEPQNKEEFIEWLQDAQHRDYLDSDAFEMIQGVIKVSDLRVRDIMVPRSQMVTLNIQTDFVDLMREVVESSHSRYPLVNEDEEVVGLLFAKDLLNIWLREKNLPEDFDLNNVLRPVLFVPESKRLNVLMRDFRTQKQHMAVVVDEFGMPSGLVTMEDVLEQIVGDIEDEYDTEDDLYILDYGNGRITVKALTPIEEFNDFFKSDLSSETADTMGGLIIEHLGHLPEKGEEVTFEDFHFKVLNADGRRVHLFRVERLTPKEGEADASLSS
jgi:magnesium and cobalt transporter